MNKQTILLKPPKTREETNIDNDELIHLASWAEAVYQDALIAWKNNDYSL